MSRRALADRIRALAARRPPDDEQTVATGMKLIVVGLTIVVVAAVLGSHS